MAKKHILIADDDLSVLSHYQNILQEDSSMDQINEALQDIGALMGEEGDQQEVSYALNQDYFVSMTTQGRDAVQLQRRYMEQGGQLTHAFIDMRMPPGIDGLETAMLLREDNPRLKICFVTAFSDITAEQIMEKLPGEHRLVRKPFHREEILQLLVE